MAPWYVRRPLRARPPRTEDHQRRNRLSAITCEDHEQAVRCLDPLEFARLLSLYCPGPSPSPSREATACDVRLVHLPQAPLHMSRRSAAPTESCAPEDIRTPMSVNFGPG